MAVFETSTKDTRTFRLATAIVFALSNVGVKGVVYDWIEVLTTGVEFPKRFVLFTYTVYVCADSPLIKNEYVELVGPLARTNVFEYVFPSKEYK
ncbi:MAG: hypothetical protein EBS59_07360 [Verrucomicrobia bacterium]|nr:hypothetical protein [Verrucomicrobiota bacterium]